MKIDKGITRAAKPGAKVMGSGCVVMILPIVFAFVYSLLSGGNMFSTGDSSGAGAVLYYLFISIPVGGIISIAGLVVMVIVVAKTSKIAALLIIAGAIVVPIVLLTLLWVFWK
jgi:hypothetical protein